MPETIRLDTGTWLRHKTSGNKKKKIRLDSLQQQKIMDRVEDNELSSVTLKSASLDLNEPSIENCGSFALLSDEIILKILKELDLKSLCRCSQVNKYFAVITKDSFLWTRVDVGYDTEQELGPGLYLDLHSKSNTGLQLKEFFKLMKNRCNHLQHLSLTFSCESEGEISKEDLIDFVKACCSQLTYLNLAFNTTIDNSIINEISLNCQNLKELRISSCANIDSDGYHSLAKLHCLESLRLDSTEIKTAPLCSILRNNQRLRILRLDDDNAINLEPVAEEMSISCPNIQSISWFFSKPLTSITLKALEKCENLRMITFENFSQGPLFKEGVRRTLFANCSSLKTFAYTVRDVDEEIEPLMDNQLENLSFTEAKITPDYLSRLLKRSPQLRSLKLIGCKVITKAQVRKFKQLYPHITFTTEFWGPMSREYR